MTNTKVAQPNSRHAFAALQDQISLSLTSIKQQLYPLAHEASLLEALQEFSQQTSPHLGDDVIRQQVLRHIKALYKLFTQPNRSEDTPTRLIRRQHPTLSPTDSSSRLSVGANRTAPITPIKKLHKSKRRGRGVQVRRNHGYIIPRQATAALNRAFGSLELPRSIEEALARHDSEWATRQLRSKGFAVVTYADDLAQGKDSSIRHQIHEVWLTIFGQRDVALSNEAAITVNTIMSHPSTSEERLQMLANWGIDTSDLSA